MDQNDWLQGRIPKNFHKLRACIACGLLLGEDRWASSERCENCGIEYENHNDVTSASFTGILAIFQPQDSWCSQWQKYISNIPGFYCIDNQGRVTDEIIKHLKRKNRPNPEWIEREMANQQ